MTTRRTNIKGKKGTRQRDTVVPFKVPSPRLSRYIYVEARGWFDPNYVPVVGAPVRQEAVFNGQPISFADVLVRAKNLEQAYQFGAAAMDTLKTEHPSEFYNHFTGQFLNDYVVKL